MTPTSHAGDMSPAIVRGGFIPLLDCAPMVIARELGFDRACGLSLELHRESSWASIRDKVVIGAFDCAHMLAPMPLASALGLVRAGQPIVVPMALNLNGNAITVSSALYAEMQAAYADAVAAGGMAAARALAAVVVKRRVEGREPLTFGMVFPFSSHNYDLRHWLAGAGIDPDADVNLIVVPPPLLAESLRAGRVDGFCVGEPWNSVAVAAGHGEIVATKSELWPRSPEKVLGVHATWATHNGALMAALVRALVMACRWIDNPANHPAAARILAMPHHVGVSAEILLGGLSGHVGRGRANDPELIVFHRGAANFPWRSHAIWHLAQMVRWGQVRQPFDLKAVAEQVYRPDIYRAAVAGLDVECPAVDYKSEGGVAADGFFAGESFDPHDVMRALDADAIRSSAVDISSFAALNMPSVRP